MIGTIAWLKLGRRLRQAKKIFMRAQRAREEGVAVKKETVTRAGDALGDVIVLLVDETPNAQQLREFFDGTVKAVQGLAAVGIPKQDRAAVASHLAERILSRVNEKILTLPE